MAKGSWSFLIIISSFLTYTNSLPPPSGSSPLDFYNSNALFAELEVSNATTSTTTYNVTAVSGGSGFFHCDGSKYRSGLRAPSCSDAISQIPRTQHDIRFRARGSSGGGATINIQVPQRFISADGQCIIEIILKDKARYGFARWIEISSAARDMYFGCVASRGQGSIATDIGPDETLGLIMTRYTPQVTCLSVRDVPSMRNCKSLLDNMGTSSIPRLYGDPKDKPDVDLPQSLRDAENKCQLLIRTPNPGATQDWSSWYEIWEGAQAVYGMCMRFGKMGTALRGRKNQLLLSIASPSYGAISS
ncbi:MAG: hypothetical protein Q9218_004090 [Villophora microphyllina]